MIKFPFIRRFVVIWRPIRRRGQSPRLHLRNLPPHYLSPLQRHISHLQLYRIFQEISREFCRNFSQFHDIYDSIQKDDFCEFKLDLQRYVQWHHSEISHLLRRIVPLHLRCGRYGRYRSFPPNSKFKFQKTTTKKSRRTKNLYEIQNF